MSVDKLRYEWAFGKLGVSGPLTEAELNSVLEKRMNELDLKFAGGSISKDEYEKSRLDLFAAYDMAAQLALPQPPLDLRSELVRTVRGVTSAWFSTLRGVAYAVAAGLHRLASAPLDETARNYMDKSTLKKSMATGRGQVKGTGKETGAFSEMNAEEEKTKQETGRKAGTGM